MGGSGRYRISELAIKAPGLLAAAVAFAMAVSLALAVSFALAMLGSVVSVPSRAYADTPLATASASGTKLPETEGLAAPYLKMDFA